MIRAIAGIEGSRNRTGLGQQKRLERRDLETIRAGLHSEVFGDLQLNLSLPRVAQAAQNGQRITIKRVAPIHISRRQRPRQVTRKQLERGGQVARVRQKRQMLTSGDQEFLIVADHLVPAQVRADGFLKLPHFQHRLEDRCQCGVRHFGAAQPTVQNRLSRLERCFGLVAQVLHQERGFAGAAIADAVAFSATPLIAPNFSRLFIPACGFVNPAKVVQRARPVTDALEPGLEIIEGRFDLGAGDARKIPQAVDDPFVFPQQVVFIPTVLIAHTVKLREVPAERHQRFLWVTAHSRGFHQRVPRVPASLHIAETVRQAHRFF